MIYSHADALRPAFLTVSTRAGIWQMKPSTLTLTGKSRIYQKRQESLVKFFSSFTNTRETQVLSGPLYFVRSPFEALQSLSDQTHLYWPPLVWPKELPNEGSDEPKRKLSKKNIKDNEQAPQHSLLSADEPKYRLTWRVILPKDKKRRIENKWFLDSHKRQNCKLSISRGQSRRGAGDFETAAKKGKT